MDLFFDNLAKNNLNISIPGIIKKIHSKMIILCMSIVLETFFKK